GFAHLKKYYETNGHADVPIYFKSGHFSLGVWLSVQRMSFKSGNCPTDRLKRMNALGVKWHPLDAAWEEGFAHLKNYFELNGHADVPGDFKSGNFSLGVWLSHQRMTYKRANYSPERLARMNALGVKWDMNVAAWEEGFAHLKKYFELNGHADVPGDFKSGKFSLGIWLLGQRAVFKKGSYPADRLKRMNALGVKWDVLAAAWEEGFVHLKAYFDLYGHADVPWKLKSGKFPLGQWLTYQRKAYQRGNYPADRLERMNSLGVKWSLKRQG
uniref:helicase associated domain-containing protein n=1 Tax=Acidovorax sp. TaxID=1872122 RepID=UPI0025BE44B0